MCVCGFSYSLSFHLNLSHYVANLSVFLPVFLCLPLLSCSCCLSHSPAPSEFYGPDLDASEKREDVPPLDSLTWPIPFLSYPAGPEDGLLEKDHFVSEDDAAVPALHTGLLPGGQGGGSWGGHEAESSSLPDSSPWSLSSGLAFFSY